MINKLTLNRVDIQKWRKNLLLFLAPVLIVYLVSVVGLIQQANTVKVTDFIPTQFTWGGIALYFLNSIIDYLKKLSSS